VSGGPRPEYGPAGEVDPGEVVVGQRTAEELGSRAVMDSREPVPVKGKREPVPAYRLRRLIG
jgi:class 3 adenylate cyclase